VQRNNTNAVQRDDVTLYDVRLLAAFRRASDPGTFEGFQKQWQRAQRLRRPQRLTAQQKRERWCTPAEKAARGSLRPRFLDRMPCRARAAPLTPTLGLLETFTRKAKVPRGLEWSAVRSDGAREVPRQPTTDEWQQYQTLCEGNVTCFTDLEKAHPINFFEQRDVCKHCGAERFLTTSDKFCCQTGTLLLHDSQAFRPNYPLPSPLLNLITSDPGLSKQSRAANDLFRFAQFALPKDTHRIPDSFQHLKVTGIPFAVLPNLNDASSTRSFLDDPYARFDQFQQLDKAIRPTTAQVEALDSLLRSENCLVRQLVNWSEASHVTARLMLKWPGTTTSVRAFTVDPAADVCVSHGKYSSHDWTRISRA